MKRFICSALLIFLLAGNSYAAIPLIYWVGSALVNATVAGTLIYTYDPATKSKSDPNGNVTQPANVTYVELPSMTVETAPVTVQLPFASLTALGNKLDPAGNPVYPNIKGALTESTTTPYPTVTAGEAGTAPATAIGSKVNINGQNLQLFSYTNVVPGGCSQTCSPANQGNLILPNGSETWVIRLGGWNSGTQTWKYSPTAAPAPVPRPATPVEVGKKLSGLTVPEFGGSPILDPYDAEIKNMLNDPDYIPVFSDATTGLPYAPPPSSSIATPAQVSAYNSKLATQEAAADAKAKSEAAVTSAQGTVTAAQNGVTTAQTRYNNAQAGLAANPTDPAAQKELIEAQAGLAGAQSGLASSQLGLSNAQAGDAKLKAELSATASEELAAETLSAPAALSKYGDDAANDFNARFNSFITTMKNSSIFGLPNQMIGNIPQGGTSTFDVSFGRYGSTVFDLASFNSAIALIRVLVLFVFTVASIRIITLKGGGG